mmetsp:Transcript_675/g.2128  ORF Transcript_675/g.2128 Transcript_675/m.2128 type:complete len:102 (-) Transcript_675:827-1132(-)
MQCCWLYARIMGHRGIVSEARRKHFCGWLRGNEKFVKEIQQKACRARLMRIRELVLRVLQMNLQVRQQQSLEGGAEGPWRAQATAAGPTKSAAASANWRPR